MTVAIEGEIIQEDGTASETNVYSSVAVDNKINQLKQICLYDRTGKEGNNYNNTTGIKGTESLNINMSSYKRLKVYGFMNARRYQFCLEIDLTDSLNTYDNNNKYWGRACLTDLSLDADTTYLFAVDCSVTQAKTIFKVENMGFRNLSDGVFSARNNNADYVITKIYGIK